MSTTYFDYSFGLSEIIPSGNRQKSDSACAFYKVVGQALKDIDKQGIFPTKKLVFIFILQFFSNQEEYQKRDIDNMCKTMLAALKNKIYEDDVQVKTLLISKQINSKIPVNFVYIGIKLSDYKDNTGMVKVNINNAISLFQGSVKQAVEK